MLLSVLLLAPEIPLGEALPQLVGAGAGEIIHLVAAVLLGVVPLVEDALVKDVVFVALLVALVDPR